MKKCIFILIIFISLPLFLMGCAKNNKANNIIDNTKPDKIMLSSPVLYWHENMVCWDEISNASYYEIDINGEVSTTLNNYFDIDITNALQTYNVKVKSVSNSGIYIDSNYSQILTLQTQQLLTPYIYTTSGDHDFEINADGNAGTIKFTTFDNTDYIKLYVNDNEYVFDCINEISITSEMCKPGNNIIRIQACSYNKLFFNSDYLTTTISKEDTPFNVRVQDGNIMYDLSTKYQNKYYDYLGYGYISVPVIKHHYLNTLNSSPVYIDVYRTRPLDTYRVNCVLDYENNEQRCTAPLRTNLSSSNLTGADYNKLEIIVYTYQGDNIIFDVDTQNIQQEVNFSVSTLYTIQKITFRLYNNSHPEYVNTIKTITNDFIF